MTKYHRILVLLWFFNIGFILMIFFLLVDRLLTAKWNAINGANRPIVSAASLGSLRPKKRYSVIPAPVRISIHVHVQSSKAIFFSSGLFSICKLYNTFLLFFIRLIHSCVIHILSSAVLSRFSETELMQYLFPVGWGPSSKRWPRWDPHLLHSTSILCIP